MTFEEDALIGLDIEASVQGGAGQAQSAIKAASQLPGESEIASTLTSALPLSSSIDSLQEAIGQGENIMNTATSAAGCAGADYSGSFAAVSAAAQSLVSELPPSAAVTLMGDAVAGAGTGAAIGMKLGTLLFPGVGTAAIGAVGAEIGAEVGLIAGSFAELEADHWNPVTFLKTLVSSGAGAGAAVGAAAGSFVPVVGTALGAGLGALIGAFASSTPAQPDYRYLSERVCFPAIPPIGNNGSVTPQGVYGVVPGTVNGSPRTKPNSTFYQLQAGPNQNWSMAFAFLVTWRSPSKSSAVSRRAAWTLAQYYCRAFSKRLGHDVSKAVSWESVVLAFEHSHTLRDPAAIAAYQKTAPQRAAKALQKMYQWYGDPKLFDATIPFKSSGGEPLIVQNTPGGTEPIKREFSRYPLDYLYIPIDTKHDLSAKVFEPCATEDRTDIFLAPDLSMMTVAEAAFLDLADVTVFHIFVQLSRCWMKCRAVDVKNFPGIYTGNNANFSRIIGLTSALIRKTGVGMTPKNIHPSVRQPSNARKPLVKAAVHGESTFGSPVPVPPSPGESSPGGTWNFKIYPFGFGLAALVIGSWLFGVGTGRSQPHAQTH